MRDRVPSIGLRSVLVAATAMPSAGELPLSRDHVVYRHPEWLMVPRALAEDLLKVAHRLGAGGVIFFSYDGLTGPSRGTEYLSQVGRAALMH
jgi:hypothetical protein